MDKELLVQNIKNFSQAKGVKPTVACRESGVGTSFINDINRGQTPSVAKVQLLASYLGITTSELLGESARTSPSLDASAMEGKSTDADPLRLALLHNFDRLNLEGRERLVETADDMVSSGKYIKSRPNELGSEKYA